MTEITPNTHQLQDHHDRFIQRLKYFSLGIASLIVIINAAVAGRWVYFNILSENNPAFGTDSNILSPVFFLIACTAFFLKFSEKNSRISLITGHILSSTIIAAGTMGIFNYFSFELIDVAPNTILFTEELTIGSRITFIFLGFALISFNNRYFPYARIYHVLALLSGIIPLFALIDFGYSIIPWYEGDTMILGFADNISFFLMSLALLLARPNHGVMRILTTPLTVSKLARQILITVCTLPILLGYVKIVGEQLNIITEQRGSSLLITLLIILFTIIIWRMAYYLYKDHIEQIQLNTRLHIERVELEKTSKQLAEKMAEVEKSKEEIRGLLNHKNTIQNLFE